MVCVYSYRSSNEAVCLGSGGHQIVRTNTDNIIENSTESMICAVFCFYIITVVCVCPVIFKVCYETKFLDEIKPTPKKIQKQESLSEFSDRLYVVMNIRYHQVKRL